MGSLFLVAPQPSGEILTTPYRNRDLADGTWLEWKPRPMPAWWPGPGRVWSGWEWAAVPGWKRHAEEGAFGIVGEAPPIDVWPEFDGVPFDKIDSSERVLMAVREKWQR